MLRGSPPPPPQSMHYSYGGRRRDGISWASHWFPHTPPANQRRGFSSGDLMPILQPKIVSDGFFAKKNYVRALCGEAMHIWIIVTFAHRFMGFIGLDNKGGVDPYIKKTFFIVIVTVLTFTDFKHILFSIQHFLFLCSYYFLRNAKHILIFSPDFDS